MTLKQFIETNNLNLSHRDRAKIGFRLKYLKSNYTYVAEKDYEVRDYGNDFFNRLDVQNIIIKYMTNG